MPVDQAKLQDFIGKAVGEWGATLGVLLAFVGDKLGLFKAMAGAGPLTPEELARKTGTHPRIIKEWLAAEAAGGYVTYDAKTAKYSLPEEQALALTDESSPAYIAGGYQIMMSTFKDEEKVIQAFKTGKGLGRGEGCRRRVWARLIYNSDGENLPKLQNSRVRLPQTLYRMGTQTRRKRRSQEPIIRSGRRERLSR